MHPDVVPRSEDLLNIGNDAFFESLENRLRLITAENALISDNRTTLDLLLTEIDGLSAVVQGRPHRQLQRCRRKTLASPVLPPAKFTLGSQPHLPALRQHWVRECVLASRPLSRRPTGPAASMAAN